MGEHGSWASDALARLLARHQCVRQQGLPRVTVLAGPPEVGAARWRAWAALVGRRVVAAPTEVRGADAVAPLWRGPAAASAAWLEAAARAAAAHAEAAPATPVALAVPRPLLDGLLARGDRLAAMLREGLAPVAAQATKRSPPARTRAQRAGAARSLAELTLFEALEATPALAGRFVLNGHLGARFGGSGAEIDLLARADAIAVEIDGYHHFRDADAYRRDRRKDALLQLEGLCVLRFLAADVLADARPALAAISEALARRLRPSRSQP